MVDGQIIACASEERFTRKKNAICYPKLSIEYCLKEANLRPKDLDLVVIASDDFPFEYWVVDHNMNFSIADRIVEQYHYWKPKLIEKKEVRFLDVFKQRIIHERYTDELRRMRAKNVDLRFGFVKEHLGIPYHKIRKFNHHDCHTYYAMYGGPFRNEKVLVFTVEGFGDDANGSLAIYNGKNIVYKYRTAEFMLGRLYRYITLLLGFKPDEHEYKVMGLAPYASDYYIKRPYQVFNSSLKVKGIGFEYKERPRDLYFWFKERLEGCRFDGIAGALQRYTEEILCDWVKNSINRFNIPIVAFSGGVSMNIKALMEISLLEKVKNIFIPPTGSDESLAMGVLYRAMKDLGYDCAHLKPVSNIYLGPSYNDRYIEGLVIKKRLKDIYMIKERVSPRYIARQLTKGKVVALFRGRMEFGARALGNRSILADPRDTKVIKRINVKIKNRDFWMPFAPTIIKERSHLYLENSKNLSSPFMTMAFKTKPRARKDIPAALHPADYTVRPQILEREQNRFFYGIIKEFEEITGVGAVLNTSFNLHGEPIACSPEDALDVFCKSDLDCLVLNNIILEKKAGHESKN